MALLRYVSIIYEYALFLFYFAFYSHPPLSICLWLYSPFGPSPLLQFLNLHTLGMTSWTEDQPVARPLPVHRTTQTQNKCTHTSMPRVGFEPTIPVLERANTVHALDCVATVIGSHPLTSPISLWRAVCSLCPLFPALSTSDHDICTWFVLMLEHSSYNVMLVTGNFN
jgi:hypothetical protein